MPTRSSWLKASKRSLRAVLQSCSCAEQHRILLFEAFNHQDILAVAHASYGESSFDSNPLIVMLVRPSIIDNLSDSESRS